MQPKRMWLVIVMMIGGFLPSALTFAVSTDRPQHPEVQAAQVDSRPAARTSVFDARQFVRATVDNARQILGPEPDLSLENLSSAAAPDRDANPAATFPTLHTLAVRLQP